MAISAAYDGCLFCIKQESDELIAEHRSCTARYSVLDWAIWAQRKAEWRDQDVNDTVEWLRMNGMWPYMHQLNPQRKLSENGEVLYGCGYWKRAQWHK